MSKRQKIYLLGMMHATLLWIVLYWVLKIIL